MEKNKSKSIMKEELICKYKFEETIRKRRYNVIFRKFLNKFLDHIFKILN
jgi:hypothetical protein